MLLVYVFRADYLTLQKPSSLLFPEESHLSHSHLIFKRIYIVPAIKTILLTSFILVLIHDIIQKMKKNNTKFGISRSTAGKPLLFEVKKDFPGSHFELPL